MSLDKTQRMEKQPSEGTRLIAELEELIVIRDVIDTYIKTPESSYKRKLNQLLHSWLSQQH